MLEGAKLTNMRIKRKKGKNKGLSLRKNKSRYYLSKAKKLINTTLIDPAGADVKMAIKIEYCNGDV
jgi:hypothetical protein